ncbi:MAG TPA: cytochrome c family protein, partial [Planctomycetota bacterium]|nr:cytochrome c family protein [Planctomycetota bacterium]
APEKVGSSVLFHAGERGRDLVRLEGARRGGKFVADRYAIEAVVATIPADPSSEEEIAKYRERLRDDGVVKKAVGALPAPGKGYAPPDTGLDLVGSEVCSKCHEGAFKVWKESKHSHGIASLVDQKKLGEFDPECLKCHAVGWFNDEGKGEVGGYDADPKGRLAGVGCESCHGPAGAHVEAPKLVKPARDVDCRKCHDDDNSPHFDRATYWPKIAHKKF